VDGGMLWRNECDGRVLRCGAGERHQHKHNPPITQQCTRRALYSIGTVTVQYLYFEMLYQTTIHT
jgi:hypothetical protein